MKRIEANELLDVFSGMILSIAWIMCWKNMQMRQIIVYKWHRCLALILIRDIITDEAYWGTLLWNRAKCGMDTDKKMVRQPREKWSVVEGQIPFNWEG